MHEISVGTEGPEAYPCGFNGLEAITGFSCGPLQHQARGLRIEDLLVHLLAELAEFDRNDGERFLSRHHADSIRAFHPLAVHQLVIFL